jgi:hypothetical protein
MLADWENSHALWLFCWDILYFVFLADYFFFFELTTLSGLALMPLARRGYCPGYVRGIKLCEYFLSELSPRVSCASNTDSIRECC